MCTSALSPLPSALCLLTGTGDRFPPTSDCWQPTGQAIAFPLPSDPRFWNAASSSYPSKSRLRPLRLVETYQTDLVASHKATRPLTSALCLLTETGDR